MGMLDPNSGSPQRSNFTGRIIGALLIAFVAWLMYMNQVQENPVTGEKQHVAISPKQEIQLGLQSAPQMSEEMGGELPDSDPRTQEVKKMGAFLVKSSEAKMSPWNFDFHLLADTKTINAFALPGGQIFITLGLFNNLDTEAELAGVLGHEMGHVIERHTAQQMAKGQLGQMLVVAVTTAATDPNNPSSSPAYIASMVNKVIQLRYGRKDESQADLWGIKIMEEAGFTPKAMIEVMEVLKKASEGSGGGSVPQIFQTHPDPDARIVDIKAYLEKNPPPPNLTEGKSIKNLHGEEQPRGKNESFDLFRILQGQ